MGNARVIGEDDIGPIFAEDDDLITDPITGGPAFPQICADPIDIGMVHVGMSMLDYFAAQVFPVLVASAFAQPNKDWPITFDEIATKAYTAAAAMVKEREARKQS